MLEKIRNLLIIISSLITIIGGVGKIAYNLFIESVKYQYKRVPAQQTNVGIVFNVLFCTATIIDILGVSSIFIRFIIGATSENKTEMTTFILPIVFITSIILLGVNFNIVRNKYIHKLTRHKYRYKKVGIWSFIAIILNIFCWGLLSLILISSIMTDISESIYLKSNSGTLIFESYLTGNDYEQLLNNSFIVIFFIVLFMISLSLLEMAFVVNKDSVYYFIRKDSVISCESYLEYIEYYLIVQNGSERYIKKSDVIEIEKINNSLKINKKKKKDNPKILLNRRKIKKKENNRT